MRDGPQFLTLEQMVVSASEMVRPPERLTVSQAAAKYRFVDNPGSYVGPWLNEKTPYLVEPMDLLTKTEYTSMVFVGPARTGKSDMMLNWITHTSICDPADMMLVHMTQHGARDWSLGELAKLFRKTKPVGDRLIPGRQNDNVHDKRFKSGMRLLVKWPSITELSGKTIRYLWLMDYDRMTLDVDGEGSPFDLAQKRTQTFRRHGMTVAESSPGHELEDPKWIPSSPHEGPPAKGIFELYNRGDRRRWYWRCPHCHNPFEPDFKLLNYPALSDFKAAGDMATLRCPHCDVDILPEQKDELNRAGKWIKDGQRWNADGSVTGETRRSDTASFWLKGAAAAFQSWSELVANYLNAKEAFRATGDEGPLKKTVTTDQGLPYVSEARKSERLPEELKARAQDWGGTAQDPVVPPGVRFLVATIDVQAGGNSAFVVQVHGFGVGGDVWLVDMFKVRTADRIDPMSKRDELAQIDPASYPEDWRVLVPEVLERTYRLGDGTERRMAVKMVGCDSGGAAGVTANAYNFWRWLKTEHPAGHHRRFRLLKGEPSRTAPQIREAFPDSQRRDRHAGARGDVPVLMINSTLLKDQVAGMLGRLDPGLGMVSFPAWAEDWLYSQLTAEVRTAERWENPRGRKNEAWDLLYYAVALAKHSPIKLESIDWSKPPSWAQEWALNDLVIKENGALPFQEAEATFDMAALAKKYA